MTEKNELEKVQKRLYDLEKRVSRLEKIREQSPAEPSGDEEPDLIFGFGSKREEGAMESKIGEYGMAWLGNIVLFFGILFLLQLLKSRDYNLVSSLFGYVSITCIYLLGRFMNKLNPHMSKLLAYNGHILLFIVTLRMHYTTSDPLIESKVAGLILLLLAIGAFISLAYRNKSERLSALIVLMVATTAIISNNTHVMLSLMVFASGFSVYLLYRFGWRSILYLSIFLVYFVFLLWFFNNPFITHDLRATESLQFSYFYLLISAFLFSVVAILPLENKITESQINGSIILNGLGFSTLLALININFFRENYYMIVGIVSAISMAYSALLQSKKVLRISGALYGLYGFALLSITIAGIFNFPLAFLLLSIESLLVLSMALWYSSRFIVLMNLLMYTGLLTAYLLSKHSINGIDISFALVALVSARIINWKRYRLNIQTEWLRNSYLVIGFIMTLLSLYRTVPHEYVTFSWAMAAGAFFVISFLLKNVKYRWLAIAALISTAIYFFIVDLKQVNAGYRIVALLIIAAISISFSLYYSRRKQRSESAGKE